MSTITLNLNDKKTYNPAFVSKILESKEQSNKGKVTRVEKDNLKEFLGL
ncbi:MAG: hypothetical protein RLZZ175_3112 [Bacteroidota bacterium]|jgi:hypothetical protein